MRRLIAGKRWSISIVIALGVSVALFVASATKRVSAATITVMNTNNGGPGSLRDAIAAAASADTINFSLAPGSTITLTTGELLINKNLTIAGPGASSLAISGNSSSRVFNVSAGTTVIISGLTIRDGVSSASTSGSSSGGAVLNAGTLTINNSTVSNNVAAGGGGAVSNTATLTIVDSTLSSNIAGIGGGVNNGGTVTILNSTVSNSSSSQHGGGIFTLGGMVTVTNCTVSNNHADSSGGGISNFSGTLIITKSTVSNNNGGEGGGIGNENGGTVTVINSTLSGNSTSGGGGGIIIGSGTGTIVNTTVFGNSARATGGVRNFGTLNVKNSIVANNNSSVTIFGGDCSNLGTFNALGTNFSTDSSCSGFTQVTTAQLSLGPLANNGGPTQTHALLFGSVAIDAVTDCTDVSGSPLTTDQRGFARPIDGDGNGTALCDVGAFEGQCITCPANITQPNDPDQCGAVVNYPNPTTIGGCGAIGCSPESGSFYPKGTTKVTCSPKQDSPFSCSFTITVNDTQGPSITCPNSIVTNTDPGHCSAVVTYTTPTATDNCDASPPVTCTPASGSPFPKGTTRVTCTAMDTSGNKGSCSFTLTVNDNQNPTIGACPSNITTNTASGQCSAVVTYTTPTANDNCPGATVTCSPSSGTAFNKGTTTVTCTATDTSGNTAQCTFTVTVNDTQAPTITCPANIVTNTDPGQCTAGVDFTATASDNCGVSSVVCTPPSDSLFPKGITTVTCTATDTSGNAKSCSFTVRVNDNEKPVITCPPDLGVFSFTDCLPAVNSAYVGQFQARFANGQVTLSNPIHFGFARCDLPPPPNGSSTHTFDSLIQADVSIGGAPPVRVQAPATVMVKVDFKGQDPDTRFFDTEMLQLDISGGNLPPGVILRESPTRPSTGQTAITRIPSGGFMIDSFFDIFIELSLDGGRTWNPSTDANGNASSHRVKAVQTTDPGRCTALVNYPAPTANDNCNVASVVCTPSSGSTFPKGTTTVTCTATDGAGNTSMCTFTVTVSDTEPPTITCPANINAAAAASCPIATSNVVTYPAPVASDNCPGVTAVCNPPSASTFAVGTTTVTCKATDAAGNMATCSFTVTVFSACLVDKTNPGSVVLFNAQAGTFQAGQYRFCCNGVTIASGFGTLTTKRCQGTIDDQKDDRKVHIQFDTAARNGLGSGTAAFKAIGGANNFKCSITDRNMQDNVCSCP